MSDMLRWSSEAAGLGKLMSVGFWAVVVRSVAAKVGDVAVQVLAVRCALATRCRGHYY